MMNVEQRMSIGPQRTNGCTKAQFIIHALECVLGSGNFFLLCRALEFNPSKQYVRIKDIHDRNSC